jgi:heparin binding hemagglutinin HbhA
MSTTDTLKQVAERGRTPLLAAVGAGDLALEQARTALTSLRSRAEALPGEAQVQVDLAAKEARTRAEQAAERARGASRQLATAVRPDAVASTVAELVEQARVQALATVEQLAERGAEVLEELRRQPGFRRFVARTEQAVDRVEDVVDEVLEETAETVSEASDEVTSLVQKAASKTAKATAKAEKAVDEVADSAKAALEETAEEAPAKPARKPATRTTSAAKATGTPATSARVTRTTKKTDA